MKLFKLPDLGEGLQEAEIVKWHVKVGDDVEIDQPLVSVETAKAVVEVPSPYAGRIARLFGNEHDLAMVGAPLVGFDGEDANADTGTVVGRVESGGRMIAEAPLAATPLARGIKATPAVRALARKLDIDLAMVTPTGADGLTTVADVQRAARILAQAGPQEMLRGVRRAMAQSMTLAHAAVASATVMDDADVDAWSADEKITSRLVRAIIAACKIEPGLNAWFDSQALGRRLLKNVDLGIAVDTPDGLLVPVLRNLERRPPEEFEPALAKLIDDARARRVPPEDLRANTITLSNFGTIAGRYASPIIVPPTVAIIGAGRLHEAIVPVNGKPSVHRILPLSLTFDHRVVTGGEAARFLGALIADLQSAK